MIAWVSGSSGKALVRNGDTYILVDGNGTDGTRTEIERSTVVEILEDWSDAYDVEADAFDDVMRLVRQASRRHDTLLATALAIDGAVDLDRRTILAEEAEKLLNDMDNWNYALGVYCSRPMPAGADILEAISISRRRALGQLEDLLETVADFMNNVELVYQAWRDISPSIFGTEQAKRVFQAEAIRAGLFTSATKRVGDPKRCEFIVDYLKQTRVARLPNSSDVVNALMGELSRYAHSVRPPAALFDDFDRQQFVISGRATPSSALRRHVGVVASAGELFPSA
jgi:hypothetical protein